MPMLYGQIMEQGILDDPSFSFMAVGDGKYDEQLQVTNFAQGMEVDSELKKLYLAGNGQGSPENYEYSAYFLHKHSDFKGSKTKPFFFLIGDAKYFPQIPKERLAQVFGEAVKKKDMDSKRMWTKVLEKN